MVRDLYNLIILSGSSNPNLVSRPHTPRSSYFLRFDNFIVFNLWLWRKWSPVCENCNKGSGLMAWYVFWAEVAQMQFLGPRPQGQIFFEISWFYWIHLMILEKMRSCLWKLQLGFWTYGLIHFLGPAKWPKCSFWVLNHRVNFFGRCYDFIGFISWFLRKWGPVCENCSLVSGHMAWQVLCQSSIWAQIVLN